MSVTETLMRPAAAGRPVHVITPDADTLIERMRGLAPSFRERAQSTEESRSVPAANIEALREAGLLKVVQPRLFGGYEHDFDVLAQLIMEAAKACPATAWVYAMNALHRWLLAKFEPEVQREILGGETDTPVCGSYAPSGKAVAAEGGYRLSGEWHYASGCDTAKWAMCAAVLPTPSGENLPAFVFMPIADWTIKDNWFVAGLSGTGSKTIVAGDAFVPAHRTLTFKELMSGQSRGLALHAGPAFGMPMLCNLPSCLASVAIGAAEGALESYIEMTGSRLTRGTIGGGGAKMAEFPTIQIRVSEAAACVDAAREVLLRDLRKRAATAHSGAKITIEDRITSRRGQAFAVSLSLRAVEALNASTGGNGLYLSHPVQRAWRDTHAVGRHFSLNWDLVGTFYGQMALGLEPKGQF